MNYRKMFKYLDSVGYKGHDCDCAGLHIHADRKYLGRTKFQQDLVIAKILYIIEKFNDDLCIIARRNNDYSVFCGDKCTSDTAVTLYGKYRNIGKRAALNLQHSNTIEFRMFRSTLKYETLLLTLELVQDIINFSKNISFEELEDMSWNDLMDTFSDALKRYYISRRNKEFEKKINKSDVFKKEKKKLRKKISDLRKRIQRCIIPMEKSNDYFVYTEKQIGTFTADEPYLEYDKDMDKTYVIATAAIPEDYTMAADIIRRKNGTKVSCELCINSMSYNAKEKYLELEDFYFSGVTCLGSEKDGTEIGEGMLGSRLDIQDFSTENNSICAKYEQLNEDKLIETLEKLNTTLSNFNINNADGKEDNQVNKFEELLKKYDKTVDDITFTYEGLSDEDLESAFAEAFEESNSKLDGNTNINYTTHGNSYIGNGQQDNAEGPGGKLNNLVIGSWWGVSFTTSCSGQTYSGKTAVGIDCREGIIKAARVNANSFNGYTINASVPSGAKFTDTNTWRGIQNNLSSDSTTDSLSAAQGKRLKELVDEKTDIHNLNYGIKFSSSSMDSNGSQNTLYPAKYENGAYSKTTGVSTYANRNNTIHIGTSANMFGDICLAGGITSLGVYNVTTTTNIPVSVTSQGYLRRYKSGSSLMIKNHIYKIGYDEAKELLNTNVYSFRYNDDGQPANGKEHAAVNRYGFVLEDMEKTFPMAVEYDEDGLPAAWCVQIVVPTILEIVKHQQSEISSLKAENEELKEKISEIDNLKKSLDELRVLITNK